MQKQSTRRQWLAVLSLGAGTAVAAPAMQTLYVDGISNTSIVDYDGEILKKAAQMTLQPGRYVMRIESGEFSYGPTFPAAPFAMVYFEGMIRPAAQTEPWPATWQVLRGKDDAFEFDVLKTTAVYATYLDRNEKNNDGGVRLSVVARP